MPRLPLRPCAAPGCPNLVAAGRCPACRGRARRAEPARPSAARRGYGRSWREYSQRYRAQHPICATPGCGMPTAHTDHIQAVTGPADPLFWLPSNHQPLCHACHSAKTAREDGGFGRRGRAPESSAKGPRPDASAPRGG